ncbi:hypothetical protein NBRC10512_005840 [Rhodotorula toruloides]|uniref:RHTO0S08e03554g1_1 n=2 Tax=Rhodotorula toruloides TaxID=5286 RepID=A0A061B6W8_RHOTO|nr:uncharacterized protein RHTO_03464 [Rhodotorula toruloides NP11]EMS20228.1 hypothetical protein RHTO_03464 [Rhodotorula toruloides NP11]CDR43618.1 RHTO0S08e03554g1_1 [Rhodotorula toruloides]
MTAGDDESALEGHTATPDSLTERAVTTDASAEAPCGNSGSSSPPPTTHTPPARSLSLDTTSLPPPSAPRRSSQQYARKAELAPPIDLATLVRPAHNSAEYSPLEAPRLPFSSRRTSTSSASSGSHSPRQTHSRASSSSSLGEQARLARVELAGRSTHVSSGSAGPAASARSTVAETGGMRRAYGGADLNESAQEQLLDEPERAKGYADPYAWERPLDAVNRYSRLLDASPVTAPSVDSRRLSRLPPGVSMLDPFGFNLTNDASPYDLALSASQAGLAAGITSPARSSVRASYIGSPAVSSTPSLSPYPSTSSTSSLPTTPSLSPAPEGSFAPGAQPWLKPRASSAGEQGMGHNRSQVRNGLLAAPNGYASPRQAYGRSKLSGEIDADAMSVASTSKRQPQSDIPGVPTDADYLNSKLYQRTMKAQKALEKERAKAAAKGKISRYDSSGPASKSTSSLSSTLGGFGGLGGMRRRSGESTRPPSIMSAAGVSGTASARRGGRKGLGWFRSSSEAALGLGSSTSPSEEIEGSIPASKSSSQISMQAGRYGAGSSSPRRGVSPNGFAPTPTMPPSPNLPSEATLRAMGVSTDQLRAAAQAPQSAQRPKSGSRQNSSEKRSPAGSALGTPVGPPSPGLEQAAAPSRPARPPPSRSATLEPPPAIPSPSLTPPPTASAASANGHPPHPPSLSTIPPRLASRTALPANVPLPASVSPTRSAFPAPAQGEPPLAPLPLDNSPTMTSPPSRLPPPVPLPQPPSAQQATLASSLRATSSTASPAATARSEPAADESLAPPVQVKRRKSGFGLLFGGFGGGSASSQRNSAQSDTPSGRKASPTPSSTTSVRQGAEGEAAREKERMLKRIGERQQEQEQEQRSKAALGSSTSSKSDAKLVKERTGGGGSGFFGRKPRLSNAPAPSAAMAPPPPKGAMAPAAPPARPKKDDASFFHPSQAIYPSREASSASQPASPQVAQQGIRAVNPSPRVPQQATAPPSANSSDSSATFASLSSSASTLPPRGQAAFPSAGEMSPQHKKGAFASLFSSYGSIRGRAKSTPTAPPASSLSSKAQSNGYPTDDKVLPVLPPPAANGLLKKPPRGQSLGTAGQPQANGQAGMLAHQKPYATYA